MGFCIRRNEPDRGKLCSGGTEFGRRIREHKGLKNQLARILSGEALIGGVDFGET